jgi:hypothetical protein
LSPVTVTSVQPPASVVPISEPSEARWVVTTSIGELQQTAGKLWSS